MFVKTTKNRKKEAVNEFESLFQRSGIRRVNMYAPHM